MIRVVLVDDEPLAIQELEYILSKVSYVQIVRTFTDAIEALNFIKVEEPDGVFMDIDMPQLSGVELTEQLKRCGVHTKVIYATAYDDYAIKAFDQNALDYLLKPYDAERIYEAVLKVKHSLKTATSADEKTVSKEKALTRLPIWIGERMLLIDVDDILYCSVDHNITTLRTANAVYEINEGLTHLESKLSKAQFLRTHRAYLVNLNKIKEISPYFNNTLVLKLEGTSDEIPVSRSYLKTFKQALNIT